MGSSNGHTIRESYTNANLLKAIYNVHFRILTEQEKILRGISSESIRTLISACIEEIGDQSVRILELMTEADEFPNDGDDPAAKAIIDAMISDADQHAKPPLHDFWILDHFNRITHQIIALTQSVRAVGNRAKNEWFIPVVDILISEGKQRAQVLEAELLKAVLPE